MTFEQELLDKYDRVLANAMQQISEQDQKIKELLRLLESTLQLLKEQEMRGR